MQKRRPVPSEMNLHNLHLIWSYKQLVQLFSLFKREMPFLPLALLSIPTVSELEAGCNLIISQMVVLTFDRNLESTPNNITKAVSLPTTWLETVASQQRN